MRRLAVLVALTLAGSLLTACSTEDDDADELRAAIARTERLAARFLYNETHDGARTVVRGIVEDDFRYKARITVEGRDTLDEVVVDDAVYVRMLDPSVVDDFLDEGADGSDGESALEGVSVLELLRARRWVVDPVGAPEVFGAASVEEELGEDPIRDALAVLKYAEVAIGQARWVGRYNPEALDYKPSQDPFPTPEEGSGVIRYDYVTPGMPRPESATSAAGTLAGPHHFRKMSVYVKDGLVIQVMEQIAATGDIADDFVRYVRTFLADIDPEAYEAFEDAVDQVPLEDRSDFLIGTINELRTLAGEDPIRARTVSLQLLDLGEDIAVDVPAGAVEGDLNLLEGRGRPPVVAEPDPRT